MEFVELAVEGALDRHFCPRGDEPCCNGLEGV